MSVKVSNVFKFYGEQAALNDVSFKVSSGEVVGFLGPNGAGKSTMMKIITCFIPSSQGKVEVCDMDVEDQSIAVRKKVGYLPEHNPLYLEMYVKEYLDFIASIYKVPKKKLRIQEMIETVGLEKEQKKKIGALSKGYRQRVGLAQAMIHDPEVLILDEPTTGLDPNQLVEIRALIKKLGETKTVMLSTHIMQEVEAICDRAIIINNGVIVADDEVKNIQYSGGASRQVIYLELDKEITRSQLMKIEGIKEVKQIEDNTWLLQSVEEEDVRKKIATFITQNGYTPLTIRKEGQSIEEAFKKLTGK